MTAQDKHNNDQWIGARPDVLIFDVNETLINFEALNPLFERVFGDKRVLREWLGHPQPGPIIGTEETCDVPARS
jgi:2-haloacid dehalogenase